MLVIPQVFFTVRVPLYIEPAVVTAGSVRVMLPALNAASTTLVKPAASAVASQVML